MDNIAQYLIQPLICYNSDKWWLKLHIHTEVFQDIILPISPSCTENTCTDYTAHYETFPMKLKHFETNEKYFYTVKPAITVPEKKRLDLALFPVSIYEKYW